MAQAGERIGEVLREMADRVIDRQELARQLQLPPRTVRRLVENYREWLSAPQSGRFTPLDLARLQIAARMSLAGRPRSAILDALATTRPTEERAERTPATAPARELPSRPRSRPDRPPQPASEAGVPRLRLHAAPEPAPASSREAPAEESEGAGSPAVQGNTEVAAASAQPEPVLSEIGKLRDVILEHAERERQDRDRVLMALVRTQQEVSHLRSELGTLKSRRDRKRGGVIRRLLG